MNKRNSSINNIGEMPIFLGKTSMTDIIAFASNTVLLLMFIFDQLFYGENMVYLIIVLGCIEVYFVLFCLSADQYCFSENKLEIRRKFRKTVEIAYDSVFNYDASIRDSLLNITQSNTVKLYYQRGEKKSAVVCRPKDAVLFIEALKQRCPEFSSEESNSKLDVFFDDKDK